MHTLLKRIKSGSDCGFNSVCCVYICTFRLIQINKSLVNTLFSTLSLTVCIYEIPTAISKALGW